MNDSRPKRMFGMTIAQLVILGCLSLMAFGTICGGLFFVSGSMRSGLTLIPSPAPTLTPHPTLTPFLTAAPTLSPTPTPIPYEDLIPPGWDQHTTESIELWVPPQFTSVDIEKELQGSIEIYKDLGYDDIAKSLEHDPPAHVLWFEHSELNTYLFTPNITIEPVLMTIDDFDAFLDQEYTGGFQEFVMVGRHEFQVSNYEARRMLFEANLSNIYVNTSQYAIFDSVNVWFITCSSHLNDFYTLLPEFDKIARTFRLISD